MEFRGDDRGVTVQIGAVLLFGILIIALATAQVAVVPDENATTEFEHNLDAQQGMGDLRNAVLAAARSGDPAAASVSLGTTYEQRTLLINPPAASGSLTTAGTGDQRVNVTIDNAVATSPYPNANAYWDGTARTYDTGSLLYKPNYNEYRDAPMTVYEHSVLANQYDDDRTLEQSGQTLIQGERINLLTLNGTLQENGVLAQNIDARPLSAYTNTVTVRSTSSDPLWINITSRFSAATWGNRILASQTTTNGGNVADVVEISTETRNSVTYYRVGIQLAPGNYELRGASVGVGAIPEGNSQPEPTYLVVTDGYDQIGNDSTGKMTVQVRDQFNNPVEDFEVNGSLDSEHLQFLNESGVEVSSITQTTDNDGYATFTYRGVKETQSGQTAWLNISMLGGGETYQYTNVSGQKVPVFSTASNDGEFASYDNPGGAGTINLQSTTIDNQDDSYLVLTLNNTKETAVNLTYARVEYYYNNPGYTGAAIANVSGSIAFPPTPAAQFDIAGDYGRLQPKATINPGVTDVTVEFQTTSNIRLEDDQYIVFTFIFEQNGKTERYRYYVTPGV